MTIEEAVNLLTVKHLENKAKKWIRDPVAYTLHEVWQIADSKVTYRPSKSITSKADRIRARSDEKLAAFCCDWFYCPDCPGHGVRAPDCANALLDWLQSPADGGDGE